MSVFNFPEIVLASQSPRRQELLRAAGINFEIRAANTAEKIPAGMNPHEVPAFLAEEKAAAVAQHAPAEKWILAADTLVLLNNEFIGKPASLEEAAMMLRKLSGNMHKVITGVCLMRGAEKKFLTDITRVFFRTLNEETIQHYITHYEVLDKAGAYAIQEWIGLIGVEKIEGDYFNVMGLPVSRVVEMLRGI